MLCFFLHESFYRDCPGTLSVTNMQTPRRNLKLITSKSYYKNSLIVRKYFSEIISGDWRVLKTGGESVLLNHILIVNSHTKFSPKSVWRNLPQISEKNAWHIYKIFLRIPTLSDYCCLS